jgi:hypothetical protein
MLLAAGMVALALAAPVTTGSAAQSSSAAASQPGPGAAAVKEFTDDELKSFAAASLQVEQIGSKWNPRISDAGNRADEEGLREQAMNEMVTAVRQKGLSVDRYNRIALAVQSDPEIARTVQTYRAARP